MRYIEDLRGEERIYSDEEERVEKISDRIELKYLLKKLRPVEADVIYKTYYERMSQGEVIAELGLSRRKFLKVMREGIEKMREELKNRGEIDG